jgi:predicted ATP-grasp superfamily ATP-dependent carboligase
MLTAAVDDLLACPGVRVKVLLDRRLTVLSDRPIERVVVGSHSEMLDRLSTLAPSAHSSLLIAPECGGVLEDLTKRVEQAEGRLLSPDSRVVRLASDKQAMAEWLLERGVPAPRGVRVSPGESLPSDFIYPAVLKPVDGAGSHRIRRLSGKGECTHAPRDASDWRLERYHEGRAASVLVLSTKQGHFALPAAWQHLTDDGTFGYCGGTTPIPEPWNQRATELALRAAVALPSYQGYLGFDLVLGSADDGRDDVVIEVNPRLTTSYIGVRQVVRENLMMPLLGAPMLGQPGDWTRRRHAANPVRFG